MLKRIAAIGLGLAGFILLGACAGNAADPATPTAPPTRIVKIVVAPTATFTPAPTQTPKPTQTLPPTRTPTPFITPPAEGQPVVLPILMYHHLQELPANSSETLKTWTVAPEQFTAQLDYLQGRGFHTVSFAQLADFFDKGTPLPEHPIILTFDDGWIDDYTVAYPALNQRGMIGTFFIPTRYADAGGEQLVDWDKVLEMDRAGMEIGGHTINHDDLTKINLTAAETELTASKAKIEAKLGHSIAALSYPFGAYNPRIVADTAAAGYRAAVILCCGFKQQSDRMLLAPRIRISYDDTLEEIIKRLPPE